MNMSASVNLNSRSEEPCCSRCASPFALYTAYLLERCGHSICAPCLKNASHKFIAQGDPDCTRAFFSVPYVCTVCSHSSTFAVLNRALSFWAFKLPLKENRITFDDRSWPENTPPEQRENNPRLNFFHTYLHKIHSLVVAWRQQTLKSVPSAQQQTSVLKFYLNDFAEQFPWSFFQQLACSSSINHNYWGPTRGYACLDFARFEYAFDLNFRPISLPVFLCRFGVECVYNVEILFYKSFKIACLCLASTEKCLVNVAALDWINDDISSAGTSDDDETMATATSTSAAEEEEAGFYKINQTTLIGRKLDNYNLVLYKRGNFSLYKRQETANLCQRNLKQFMKQTAYFDSQFKLLCTAWGIAEFVSTL